jgi:predicted membrane chloride channel (bestrophin family)
LIVGSVGNIVVIRIVPIVLGNSSSLCSRYGPAVIIIIVCAPPRTTNFASSPEIVVVSITVGIRLGFRRRRRRSRLEPRRIGLIDRVISRVRIKIEVVFATDGVDL